MLGLDPDRLRMEADQLALSVGRPEDLVASLANLLAFYADRTRRSSASVRAADALPSYRAPRPVLQAIVRALNLRLADEPDDIRQQLITCLWQAEHLEPRLVAIDLLAGLPWQLAVSGSEQMAEATNDRILHTTLAKRGLAGWVRLPLTKSLEPTQRWLASSNLAFQRLALCLLQQQASQVAHTELAALFDVLAGRAAQLPGESGRAVRQLLHVLSQRNQAETARFLLDELRRNNRRAPYRRLVRDLMPAFGPPFDQELAIALSLK
jgi:hypothetical protein